jgi:hypothetical protein
MGYRHPCPPSPPVIPKERSDEESPPTKVLAQPVFSPEPAFCQPLRVEHQFLGALRRFHDRLNQRDAHLAVLQLQNAVNGAPAGVVTASFSSAGWSPVSSTVRAAPSIVCAASNVATSRGKPAFTPPSASDSNAPPRTKTSCRILWRTAYWASRAPRTHWAPDAVQSILWSPKPPPTPPASRV